MLLNFFLFFEWLPPFLSSFIMSTSSIFLLYLTFKFLKLLWDILPFA